MTAITLTHIDIYISFFTIEFHFTFRFFLYYNSVMIHMLTLSSCAKLQIITKPTKRKNISKDNDRDRETVLNEHLV